MICTSQVIWADDTCQGSPSDARDTQQLARHPADRVPAIATGAKMQGMAADAATAAGSGPLLMVWWRPALSTTPTCKTQVVPNLSIWCGSISAMGQWHMQQRTVWNLGHTSSNPAMCIMDPSKQEPPRRGGPGLQRWAAEPPPAGRRRREGPKRRATAGSWAAAAGLAAPATTLPPPAAMQVRMDHHRTAASTATQQALWHL